MRELDPRIKIRAPLRCDGIGRLDCAEDTESGGRLAVRWLPLEANGDAAARACERLPEHPVLPRIRQTGQVGGAAFVAMDFPEGQLLSTLLDERLDLELLLRIGAQVAHALATVHDQGVVHGELGAESILVVPPDRAWLWDMPLVIANRLTDRRGEDRLMRNLVRLAPYLAPERAQGGGASRESDIYGLGAVLCVAGGAPLPQAATTLGVVHTIANGDWTPRVPSSIPEPFASLLSLMVSPHPEVRPTAQDVADAFASAPPTTTMPTVPEFPVVRLPPELQAAADALVRRPTGESFSHAAKANVHIGHAEVSAEVAEEIFRRPTVEVPVVVPPEASGPHHLGAALEVKRAEAAEADADRTVETPADEVEAVPAVEAKPAAGSTSGPTKVSGPQSIAAAPTTTSGPQRAVVEAEASTKTSGPQAAVADAPKAVVSELLTSRPARRSSAPSAELASVALTDNVSVSQELADAGAVVLDPEAQALVEARARRQLLAIGGSLLVAVVILLAVALTLATRNNQAAADAEARTPAKTSPRRPAVKKAPAKRAAPVVDDDLAPLVAPEAEANRPVPAPVRAPVRTRLARRAVAEPLAAPAPAAEAAAPERADFGFLEPGEKPTSELKRPSF